MKGERGEMSNRASVVRLPCRDLTACPLLLPSEPEGQRRKLPGVHCGFPYTGMCKTSLFHVADARDISVDSTVHVLSPDVESPVSSSDSVSC